MAVTGAIIVPHPPLIIPDVGKGEEKQIQATTDAFCAASELVASWRPDALVLASPHVVLYSDYFHISPGEGAKGDLSAFRAPRARLETEYSEALREAIISCAVAKGIDAGTLGERDARLDHATFIPLHFLRKAGVNCPIVRMGLSGFSALEHYRLGRCVAEAAEALGLRVAFIASGDLSHKLKADGPYGFAPQGPEFDRSVTDAMANGDFMRFLTMDDAFCDGAAECGMRSFQIMAGALDGLAVEPKLLSYEGTFGVGYAVATFEVTGADEARRFAHKYMSAERARLDAKKAAEDPWVRLARLSIETYVGKGERLSELPGGLPVEMTARAAGAFVSLHMHGRLRGCIGTIMPTCESVAEEIVRNAVSAACDDPRFPPVRPDELPMLEYKVDVLGAPERIASPDELDAKRYGVIVSHGRKRGLLLPDLDGVDTVEQQIDIARQKGGIRPGEKYELERFEVVRHT